MGACAQLAQQAAAAATDVTERASTVWSLPL
jgi:hypothetical protein